MYFIQLGREVVPRNIAMRHHKAVIVGIKNEKLVVIQKQDKSREMVRTRDFVMTEKVYDMEDLQKSTCEFYNVEEAPKKTSDFDRHIAGLRQKIISDMVREKGL